MGIAASAVAVIAFVTSLASSKREPLPPDGQGNFLNFNFRSLFNIGSPIHITQQTIQGGELTLAALKAIAAAVEKGNKEGAELEAQLEKSQKIIRELRADLECDPWGAARRGWRLRNEAAGSVARCREADGDLQGSG